jgi:hypothetical protein
MVIIRCCTAAALLLVAGCASTPPVTLQITSSGIYTAVTDSRVAAPDSIVGTRAFVSSIRALRETSVVKAELGTRFGFQFEVSGPRPGTVVKLRARQTFPPGGLTNSQTRRHATFDEREIQCVVGAACLNGRHLSEQWELVPGKWTFDVFVNDNVVLRREFEVVAP